MNQPRPSNHVTRALGLSQPEAPHKPTFPPADAALITALEEEYPARCLGTRESVEDHLRYAGKVELIAMLRADHNARMDATVDDSDFEPDLVDLVRSGERAS